MRRVHVLPGSTSSNVVERGDYPAEEKAVLSELGKTPAAAWAEGIAENGAPRLPADPRGFVRDFLPFKEREVGRQGIRLFNIMYYDDALANIINSSSRKRRIKYNPRDMSVVFVDMPDGKHLPVRYADLRRPPISLWEHRLAAKTLKEQGRGTINEPAIFRAIEAQRQILEQAKAASKAARRAAARLPNGESGEQRGRRRPGPSGTRDRGHERQRQGSLEEVRWPDNKDADVYDNAGCENWESEVLE
jgi:putative transposase